MPPRFLYLHGFASGPQSKKGTAFARHYEGRFAIERLDLRVPSFEHLRLSAMLDRVTAALEPGAVVIGSSLGGLTAARVAERDPRIARLVLMAPAFQLAARWQSQLGDDELAEWQRTGWRTVLDRTTGREARIDYGFLEDVLAIDQGFPAVTVPTLILHGTRDDVVPVDNSRRFAQGKSNVRLIELDDDHELVASLPRILDETDRFLAELI